MSIEESQYIKKWEKEKEYKIVNKCIAIKTTFIVICPAQVEGGVPFFLL
ncbi:hypothetical protein CDL12_13359 [Handroanthus impetiginosus]|uniref:Uncharacterized protein n=1 Tax=Handroanthus impetiginosus TaxID=429701 RepID=A0A2G9H915_9LAMI|nr:hypothetical protein CDL12_13359 [Handroanthus impetiginosus]